MALTLVAVPTEAQDAMGLQREVMQLRSELRQQQDLVLLLRSRLAEAEAVRAWLPWLALGLASSVAVATWLAFRGRRSPPDKAGPNRHAPLPAREGDEDNGPATVFAPGLDGLFNQESSTAVTQVRTDEVLRPGDRKAVTAVAQKASGSVNAAAEPDVLPLRVEDMLAPVIASAAASEAAAGAADKSGSSSEAGAETELVNPPAAAASPAAPTLAAAPAVSRGLEPAPTPRVPTTEPALRPAEMTMAGQPPRAVSVEELFDLEQQVDFFLVLGQTESAVDLLVGHIRATGGNSALPYLKLMEVYRQQGDAESYERTRKRFNQRFNAHAPEWSVSLSAGRTLEGYPEVIARLQRVWHLPLDALAELEALMFRRTRGELFDLPAFRDVLVLHAMAVDLHERSPMSSSKVDILLPLGEENQGNTSPLPHVVSFAPSVAGVSEPMRSLLSDWSGLEDPPTVQRPAAGSPVPPAVPNAVSTSPFTAPNTRPSANGQASAGGVAAAMPASKPQPSALQPAHPASGMVLDLDLSDFAPAPKDYTHPAAFTDLALGKGRGSLPAQPGLPAAAGNPSAST